MANFYSGANEMDQHIILVLDPYISFASNGIVTYGFIGIWVLVISILGLKNSKLPKAISIFGILLGISLVVVVIQGMGPAFVAISNTTRGILSFLWFSIVGCYLLKQNSKKE